MGDSQRALRRAALDLAVTSGDDLREHARRVARLGLVIADGLGVDERCRDDVELCALLHDVGKSALPMRVLAKAAPLDEEEWALMLIHTVEGQRMVVDAGLGARLGALVRATHERWDGNGYPDGLAGTDIPLASRIVFCADAFDAMTSARPYRRALPKVAAVAEIRRGAGTQFDPRVAGRFAAIVERLEGRFRRTPQNRDPRAAFPR
jgi:HD-GYP domain-containing protein (c-di-GMP phosphodiesterase class II)